MDVELRFRTEGNANVIFRIASLSPARDQRDQRPLGQAEHAVRDTDKHGVLEPDWRFSDDPCEQRRYNQKMRARRRELLTPYAQNGQQHDFARNVNQHNLTGARETLLRLKKQMPFYQDDETTYNFYINTVADWIPPRHLVQQDLIQLGDDFIQECNKELRLQEKNGNRDRSRYGKYLHSTKKALVLRDMESDNPDKSVTLEFKPKWLWQSPHAPKGATRCRTCALRVKRKSEGKKESKTHGILCPLSIATGKPALVREAIDMLVENPENYVGCRPAWLVQNSHNRRSSTFPLQKATPRTQEDLVAILHEHFAIKPDGTKGEGHRVLEGLCNLQKMLDPNGILNHEGDPTDDFLLAMTLRDCSLYVQVQWDGRRVESRLGDLDPKVAKGGKLEQWRETERELRDGGWYFAPAGDETCLLSRPSVATWLDEYWLPHAKDDPCMDRNILNVLNDSGQANDHLELNVFTRQALLEHQERAPLTPETHSQRTFVDYDFWCLQGIFVAYFPDEGTRYWMAKDWAEDSPREYRQRYAYENKEHAKHGGELGGLLQALQAGNEGDSRGPKQCLICILEQTDLLPYKSSGSSDSSLRIGEAT